LHVGEYVLREGMTPRELLEAMSRGDIVQHRFTIVEGWNIRELRAALARAGVLAQETEDLDDAALMEALGREGEHPEGRFLPETYVFTRGDSDLDVLARAARAMDEALAEAWEARDPDTPLRTPYEMLILASIVEKETGIAEERPRIAGLLRAGCASACACRPTRPSSTASARTTTATSGASTSRPTPPTTPTPATACRPRRSPCPAAPRCRPSPPRRRAPRCTSSPWATAVAATCSPTATPSTRPTCAATCAIIVSTCAGWRQGNSDRHAPHRTTPGDPGGGRGRRQEHRARRAPDPAGGGRRSRGVHPRARRHATGGADPRAAARCQPRGPGARHRAAADVRRARAARAGDDRPGTGPGGLG